MPARARPDVWPETVRRGSVPGRFRAVLVEALRGRVPPPELLLVAGVDRGGLATRARSGTPGGGEDEARGQTAQAEGCRVTVVKSTREKKSEKKHRGIDKHGIKLYNVINAGFSAPNITR